MATRSQEDATKGLQFSEESPQAFSRLLLYMVTGSIGPLLNKTVAFNMPGGLHHKVPDLMPVMQLFVMADKLHILGVMDEAAEMLVRQSGLGWYAFNDDRRAIAMPPEKILWRHCNGSSDPLYLDKLEIELDSDMQRYKVSSHVLGTDREDGEVALEIHGMTDYRYVGVIGEYRVYRAGLWMPGSETITQLPKVARVSHEVREIIRQLDELAE